MSLVSLTMIIIVIIMMMIIAVRRKTVEISVLKVLDYNVSRVVQ